ncbi:MAG: archaeosine biosynthesis radical SAM protein RaSEA [bacterium]|nr:archaeosine biosynthesis radical SAM protein RaSEA [bacterium]
MKRVEKHAGELRSDGLSHELSNNRYFKIISDIQKHIHSQIPEEKFDTTEVAKPTEVRREIFEGVYHKRAVVFLMSNGCEWALKDAHGCTMCGHIGKQTRRIESIPAEDFIHQFNEEFDRFDFNEFPLLNIYNNGSFLNDREIPAKARQDILEKVDSNPHIKMVVIETRPEFVTEEKILEIKRLLPHKQVEIAIGLELKNNTYRKLCLNKGFPLKCFDAAATIISRHLHLRAYVFVKPPFLTEKESIDEAVRTVEHAFAQGCTTVSLEACTIQDHTLVKFLYDRQMYLPPRLWSIMEVVKRSVPNGRKLLIGLFKFYPSPNAVPYNCPECSDRVMEAIVKYNSTLDVGALEGLDCSCKQQWKEALKKDPQAFENNLSEILQELKLKG